MKIYDFNVRNAKGEEVPMTTPEKIEKDILKLL